MFRFAAGERHRSAAQNGADDRQGTVRVASRHRERAAAEERLCRSRRPIGSGAARSGARRCEGASVRASEKQ